MRNWFTFALMVAVGICVSLVLSVILVQVQYTGSGAPLKALTSQDVRHAMWLSFGVATVAAFGAAFLAIPAGYALARWEFRGKVWLEGLMVIPILMSPIALGVSLLLLFRTYPGQWIENHVIRFVFEVPGMVLAQFLVALSLETLISRSTFEGVNIRYEQVARFLGCTPWGAFRLVALPLARNGLLAAVLLGWARAIGDFGATAMIAGAVKGKTETMPVSIYLSMASVSIDKAVTLSVVLTLVTMVSLAAVIGLTGKARQ